MAGGAPDFAAILAQVQAAQGATGTSPKVFMGRSFSRMPRGRTGCLSGDEERDCELLHARRGQVEVVPDV